MGVYIRKNIGSYWLLFEYAQNYDMFVYEWNIEYDYNRDERIYQWSASLKNDMGFDTLGTYAFEEEKDGRGEPVSHEYCISKGQILTQLIKLRHS